MYHADYLESELLTKAGFRHAFFTRLGGSSAGPYASLNFSTSVGDSADNVNQNFERAAAALGTSRARIFFASQVHGSDVRSLRQSDSPAGVLHENADGLVAGQPGFACAIRTADCVPILFADRLSGAVAAAHAGWRGVVAGIVARTVHALRDEIGGRSALIAAIGPHISLAAFEVSEDVAVDIASAAKDPTVVNRKLGPKPHVDLRRAVRAQLRGLGFAHDAIEDVHGCTYGDPARFFSFRRDGRESGRHLSAIVARRLPEPARRPR